MYYNTQLSVHKSITHTHAHTHTHIHTQRHTYKLISITFAHIHVYSTHTPTHTQTETHKHVARDFSCFNHQPQWPNDNDIIYFPHNKLFLISLSLTYSPTYCYKMHYDTINAKHHYLPCHILLLMIRST